MKAETQTPQHARILALVGPQQLTYLEHPLPSLGRNDVMVKSLFSGVSHGTEMNVYRGRAPQLTKYFDPQLRLFLPVDTQKQNVTPARGYWKPSDSNWGYPLAYGYANVGRVVRCGEDVTNVRAGDLVYAYEPHQDCYVAAADSVVRLPELADPALGVLFANLNTAYNGVLDAGVHLDDIVVIFGQGVVGLLVTQFVRRVGPQKIIVVDALAKRRQLALELGADMALDPSAGDIALQVRTMTEGRGADVVIEVSGSYAALQEAIRTAAYNTTVTAMSWYGGTGEALRLADEFHHNRIAIRCSQVAGIAPELSATHTIARRTQNVLAAFGELELAPLLTNVVPFEEAKSAYELIDKHSEEVVQVLLAY